MESSKMNDILMKALQTSKTGKRLTIRDFKSKEEYDMYVMTVEEMKLFKGKKVVWMPE